MYAKRLLSKMIPALPDLRGKAEGDLRRYLMAGALGTFGLIVVSTGLGVVNNILLARWLGVVEYGVYSYSLAWVGLLSIAAVLGLDRLVVREIAACEATSSWSLLRGLLRWSGRTVLGSSLGLVTVATLLVWTLREHIGSEMFPAFWVALATLPLMSCTTLISAILQGLRRVVYGRAAGALSRLLFLGALALLTLQSSGRGTGAVWAVALNGLVTGAACAIGLATLAKVIPDAARQVTPESSAVKWFAGAIPLLVVAAIFEANSRVGTIMVGAVGGAQTAGVYSVAKLIADSIGFILVAVNATFAPVISGLYTGGDVRLLQRVTTHSARLTMSVSLMVALSVVLLQGPILLLFGAGFTAAGTSLVILCVGQLINAAAGSAGNLLIMTGNEKCVIAGMGAAIVLNVGLSAFLIPRWGVDGAAVATAGGMATWNVLLVVLARRRLGIDSTAFGWSGQAARRESA